MLYALFIASQMDLSDDETEVLCMASVFHDSRRQDDWYDVGHGQRAAEYYREYCRQSEIRYDPRCYDITYYHDRDDEIGIAAMEPQGSLENEVLLYRILKIQMHWIDSGWDQMVWMWLFCEPKQQSRFIPMRSICGRISFLSWEKKRIKAICGIESIKKQRLGHFLTFRETVETLLKSKNQIEKSSLCIGKLRYQNCFFFILSFLIIIN